MASTMKPVCCPICHTQFTLDAIVMDEAQRELWRLILGLPIDLQGAIVPYIGLFRSGKGGISNAKALALTKEVLALHSNQDVLARALSNTVTRILAKRGESAAGSNRPLQNHNYLKSVIADTPASQELMPGEKIRHVQHPSSTSKSGEAMQLLLNRK